MSALGTSYEHDSYTCGLVPWIVSAILGLLELAILGGRGYGCEVGG